MRIGGVTNHRSREGGGIIYPVYSRRSGGLSIGVNLFPDHKVCSFDCPYCEVFPFTGDRAFNLEAMEAALGLAILEARKNNIPVKDICFSGNGEPFLSPHFTGALRAAAAIRGKLVPEAKLVVITNGSGLLDPALFDVCAAASRPAQAENTGPVPGMDLHIWLKLDAGTEAWYLAMDRSAIPHGQLLSRIRDFAASGSPFTIQTMLCSINGALPPPEESAAWVKRVRELAVLSADSGAAEKKPLIRAVQIYGKARPAPEDPLAAPVPLHILEERAALLRTALAEARLALPVDVYL